MPAQDKELQHLTEMRARTVAEIARLKQELQAEVEPASASDDDAAVDVAADIYERSKIISLIHSLEAKLHSLERAMELAAEGRYGICEKCGVEIPVERLEIVPETTLCVRCAGELELGMRRSQSRAVSRSARRPRYYDDDDDDGE